MYNTTKIPVVCEQCGTIALTDQISFKGKAFIANNKFVNACPRCGEDMYTIDGTYRVVDDVVKLLRSPEADVQEVNELLRILREAEDEDWSEEEIRTAVNQRAPSFSWVLEIIPDDPRWRALFFLVLGIVINTSISKYFSAREEAREQRQHEQIVEQIDELSKEVEKKCDISGEGKARLRRIIQHEIEEQTDSQSVDVDN